MKAVFADTSYYLALVNPKDRWHARAVELAESILGRIFVTEHVLLELGCALTRATDRGVFLRTLELIETEGNSIIIPASAQLFRQGLALFADRPDKDWSLVDCISFVVMKQRRLTDALTADRHFSQAGFKALLT